MVKTISLGGQLIEVVKKDIKNIHLSVYPPSGHVRISVPLLMKMDVVRVFAVSKLPWIRKQQKKVREQERESRREYLSHESHYVWGKRYLMKLIEDDEAPAYVRLGHKALILSVHRGAAWEKRREVVDDWYRQRLKKAISPLVAKWEPLLGVRVEKFFVQRMKTKWGSCNPRRRTIRINTELAKKPKSCLEYIVVHELVHLIEATHNARFVRIMDRHIPNWKHRRAILNQLPVRHEEWRY